MGGKSSKVRKNSNDKDKLENKYALMHDEYHSIEQVKQALVDAGLESSKLIVGIDFTKSNEWSGKYSYSGRNLHDVANSLNPYEEALSVIARTLSSFDDDDQIQCFGFGDTYTRDNDVFHFYHDKRPCNGLIGALLRYRELVPTLSLAGWTNILCSYHQNCQDIVDDSGGQFHILLIIADGQVARTEGSKISKQEKDTIEAIVKASKHPLSIVLVGVGDGPWDMMEKFADSIPKRNFDNFQFVNFTEIMSRKTSHLKKEADFAVAALTEIPEQYKAVVDLKLLGKQRGVRPRMCAFPPHTNYVVPKKGPPNDMWCSACMLRLNNLSLGCGHKTCFRCAEQQHFCPICHVPIETKTDLL